MTSARPRWRFQYRLRTLLAFMLLASIFFAWLGTKVRAAAAQREVVVHLRGGYWYDDQCHGPNDWVFRFDNHDDFAGRGWIIRGSDAGSISRWLWSVVGEDMLRTVVAVTCADDASLKEACNLPCLRELDLFGSHVTDAGVKHIPKLHRLELLDLGNTAVSDGGLGNLRALTGLKRLCLPGMRTTDAGIVNLQQLKNLEWLDFNHAPVTDAALSNIRELVRLRRLDLSFTSITDGGLKDLAGMSQLKELDLTQTGVSANGVKWLQATLPNCKVDGG